MGFQPGKSGNPLGKPPGTKNKEDLASLRNILKKCFSEKRWVIEARINKLLEEASDINDFKWLMNLKASLEPKEVVVDAPQQQQIVLIRSNVTDVEAKPVETADTNGLDNRITDDSKIQA